MRVFGIVSVLAAIVAASATLPAAAQSRYCLSLQLELAALDNPDSTVKPDQTALRQELKRARADARRAGCRAGLFSRNKGKRSCRSALSRVNRLERQLSGSRSGGLFGFGRTPEERQRDGIRRAMSRAGCSETYRTICVRVCDGYYFPLSFATTRQRFASDAAKCMNQYELGEAALFYYPNPGGNVSQAVSISGARYLNQPYAFHYRTTFVPQCAARLHTGLTSLGERAGATPSTMGEMFETAVATRMAAPSIPIPIARASWSSDPETLANRAGDLVPETILPPTETAVVVAGEASRTVGDKYYFAKSNPGPPATVAGYETPALQDFRVPRETESPPITR